MQLLPLRGRVSLPHSLNLGWLCNLLWPIAAVVLYDFWTYATKTLVALILLPWKPAATLKKKVWLFYLERPNGEREEDKIAQNEVWGSATPAEVLDMSAHIWDPPAPSKLSEAKPHGIEISHSKKVLPKLQNHKQTNGVCFKTLSFWVVCFTLDKWTGKSKWDSTLHPVAGRCRCSRNKCSLPIKTWSWEITDLTNGNATLLANLTSSVQMQSNEY